MKHERVVAAMIVAIFAAPSCGTMSDASYRVLMGDTRTLVKNEAYRPPPEQYGVVPTVEYDCSLARWPPAMPEVLIDSKKMCPQTANVSQYDCVDHSGKIVRWERCEGSRAPLLYFDIPFPYGGTRAHGTPAQAELSEWIAAQFRHPESIRKLSAH
jgi:hypothetical protein